jgi:hypothetical protein
MYITKANIPKLISKHQDKIKLISVYKLFLDAK